MHAHVYMYIQGSYQQRCQLKEMIVLAQVVGGRSVRLWNQRSKVNPDWDGLSCSGENTWGNVVTSELDLELIAETHLLNGGLRTVVTP